MPASTAWLGDQHNRPVPTAVYAAVLFFAGVAYFVLQQCIIAQEPDSDLARAIGRDAKGILSAALYAVAFGLAFVNPLFSDAIFVFVAAMWLVPDRRIESQISPQTSE